MRHPSVNNSNPNSNVTTDKRQTGNGISGRGSGAVTLDDVAKLAGVSPITVSRAMNQPDKVARKTLEKINQAIARTGYVPNLLAGGLASRRSRLIAAIIPSMANSVYAETVRAFSERLRDAGYQVFLGETGFSEQQEESLLSAVLSRKPDGILLTGINHSPECRRRLLAANIPVVETWDLTPTPLDIVIGFSHENIGRSVAEYLVRKGYRRFAIVSATDHRAQIRQKAFIETLASLGYRDVPVSNVPAPTSFKLGRQGLRQLLDLGFDQGAIFFSSDTLAQGAMAEAQSRDIAIPGDLAFIGFGDQPYAAYTHPALTTVRFDLTEIGQRSAEALLARINNDPISDRVIDVGFTIVERETT
ncbi:MAG: LacI family DNA-binding transcriptional regulator [Desulfuromonadales bacterium]